MTEIVSRIHQIIQEQQLSAAAFADSIGVQRSSISHVLSGRNKPSLDFILKTLQAFPHVSSQWLLFGKGTPTLLSTPKETQATDGDANEPPPRVISRELGDGVDKIVFFFKDGSFQTYQQKS